MGDLAKLKVADLRKKLEEEGLATSGKKDELIARLQDHLDKREAEKKSEPEPVEEPKPKKTEEPVKEAVEPGMVVDDGESRRKLQREPVSKVVEAELTSEEKQKMRAERFGLNVEEVREKLSQSKPKGRDKSKNREGAATKRDTPPKREIKIRNPDIGAVNVDASALEARKARFGL